MHLDILIVRGSKRKLVHPTSSALFDKKKKETLIVYVHIRLYIYIYIEKKMYSVRLSVLQC